MKTKLILVLIIFINILCYSQDPPKIIPPTPEAANISRYADIPVSLYTGKPQVEFPLYSLKCGNLELPISLSYYASGVKVEEYSTWAGIGWALNAGGVITKSVKGSSYASGGQLDTYLPLRGTPAENFNSLLALDNYNTERDIYNFNFSKYSGSFQIKNNKAVFRKHVNLKVDFPSYGFVTITDDNGIKYYFESKSSGEFQTDYYLIKIESADKLHTINLEYTSGDSFGKPPHNSVFYSLYPVYYIRYSSNNFESKHSGYLLSKIYTSCNDSVVFIKKDILQPKESAMNNTYRKALDSIYVFNGVEKRFKFHFKTNNVKTIKPYEPNVSYPFGYPTSKVNTEMNYRLYLDGFDKIDATGNTIESYGFDYYGRTNDGRDSLPNRYSLAQDFGGYYNGQDYNTTLIPSFNQKVPLYGDHRLSDGDDYKIIDPTSASVYEVDVNIAGANRDSNLQDMVLGTLKSIKYPTKGFVEFYYSQMDNPLTNQPFWGLKIDKIEYLDHDKTFLKRKKYSYANPVLGYPMPSFWNYTLIHGTGVITPFPNKCDYQSYDLDCQHNYSSTDWAMQLSPDSVNDVGMNEGSMIGYGVVDEIEEGNGRKQYLFSTEGASQEEAKDYEFGVFVISSIRNVVSGPVAGFYNTSYPIYNAWPLGPLPNNNWKMGTLLSETTYNQNQNILAKQSYHYSYPILDTLPNIKVHKVGVQVVGGYSEDNTFFYHEYNNLSVWERLDSIAETIDGITKITNYDYDDRKQISQISTTKSNGDSFTTNFKYPYNYSSTVYNNMVSRNMITPVIEKTETINTDQKELIKTNFSFWKPEASSNNLNMTTANDVTNYIYPLTVEAKLGESPIETRLNYNSYDNKGNITSVSKTNDREEIYIWGYDSQYPIAKIENATYQQVSSQVANLQTKTDLDDDRTVDIINSDGTINYQGNEGVLRFALASLRDSLPNAMVTTYTYDSLIGVTSITNPKGFTIYYEYDAFNRLKQIKDQDGKIVSANEYHYKNQ